MFGWLFKSKAERVRAKAERAQERADRAQERVERAKARKAQAKAGVNQELLQATRNSNSENMMEALKKGADPSFVDLKSGDSVLNIAIQNDDMYGALKLIKAGANVSFFSAAGNSPLLLAIGHGNHMLPLVKAILDSGLKVVGHRKKGMPNAGATPLFLAALVGADSVYNLLLKHGAGPGVATDDGHSIMYAASAGGSVKILRSLLRKRHDINEIIPNGYRPIHIAAMHGHVDAVMWFLENDVSIEEKADGGATPLAIAALYDQGYVVQLLARRGANLEVVFDLKGEQVTPLMVAVVRGFDRVIRFLTDEGLLVDGSIPGSKSITELAKQSGQATTSKLLAEIRKAQKAKPPKMKSASSAGAKKQRVNSGESLAKGGRKPARQTSVVSMGIYCTDLRYDEEEHGDCLPRDFKKAQGEWVKSKNDKSSPHYQNACKILSKWYQSKFEVWSGISFSMGSDNDINISANSEASAKPFASHPVLKRLIVVSVDFRKEASDSRLKSKEPLQNSPEVGIIALYDAKLRKNMGPAKRFQKFIATSGQEIIDCFSIGLKDAALKVEVDDSGFKSTMTSCSSSGLCLEVNCGMAADEFAKHMEALVHDELHGPSSPDDSASDMKQLIALAENKEIQRLLNEGLDVNASFDGEPLLMLALTAAIVAEHLFENDELAGQLSKRFKTAGAYKSAVTRIAADLIGRGADVNVEGKVMSVIQAAEMLDNKRIIDLCRKNLSSKPTINLHDVLMAAERGDLEKMKSFVKNGANINERMPEFLLTPLMLASQGPGGEDGLPLKGKQLTDHKKMVQFLIKSGADLDAVGSDGNTAIGNAVRVGNTGIVRILLKAGAKTSNALPKGQSLISMARERGHKEIVKLLTA